MRRKFPGQMHTVHMAFYLMYPSLNPDHLHKKPLTTEYLCLILTVRIAMSEILVVTCPGGRQCSFLFPLLYNKSKFKLHLVAHIVESTSRIQETYPDV
jgi:hypothetical protein